MATKTSYTPTLGDPVVVTIAEGHAVRDPLSLVKLADGDVVIWSTHFQRRLNEGSLTVSQYKPEKPTKSSSSSGGKE
jgi:hypothetical protein